MSGALVYFGMVPVRTPSRIAPLALDYDRRGPFPEFSWPADMANHIEGIKRDMNSEFAANWFWAALKARFKSLGIVLGRDAEAFFWRWKMEEDSHFRKLAMIVGAYEGKTLKQIQSEMLQQKPDFSDTYWTLRSPLAALTTVYWDEFWTAYYYMQDRPIYEQMGPQVLKWFNNVIIDESHHCKGALSIIQSQKRKVKAKIGRLIKRLEEMEIQRLEERQKGLIIERHTFVLDRGESGATTVDDIHRRAEKLQALAMSDFRPQVELPLTLAA